MKRSFPLRASLSLWLLVPATAHAAGLYAGENGAQAAQRGGAFIAKSDDSTALYHNPAGLVKGKGFELQLGTSFVSFSQTFDRSGTYEPTTAAQQPAWVGDEYPEVSISEFKVIPAIFVGYGAEKWGVGAGIFAPHGMPTRNYDTDECGRRDSATPGPQRYDTITQDALVLFPSIGGSYRPHPMIDIGVRASYGFGSIKGKSAVWAVGNDEEDENFDADFCLDVKDNFMPNWGAGILFRPTPWIEIGVAYASKVEVRTEGKGIAVLGSAVAMPLPGQMTQVGPVPDEDAQCAPGGTMAELKACIDFDLPQKATGGVRVIKRDGLGREQADLELDFRWEQWSKGSDVDIIVDGMDSLTGRRLQRVKLKHGFKDTIGVKLGGSWRIDMGAGKALDLRSGVGYETGAAPNSWTRVDYDGLDRITLAGGVGYSFSRFRVDAGVSYLHSLSREVDEQTSEPAERDRPDPVQPLETEMGQDWQPFNAGKYASHYLVGILGVTAWF